MDELTKAELERLHDEENRQNHRIDELEVKVGSITDLIIEIKELSTNMKHMLESQQAMRADLDVIKQKPASAWEKAVWIVLAALIGYALKAAGIL